MSSDFEHIFKVGQLVDSLELYLRDLKTSDDFESSQINKIEDEFEKFYLETEDKDAVPVYYYTLANYHAFLKVLALKDFDAIKSISRYFNKYKTNEDYLKNNHSLRAEVYRQAIKPFQKILN